MEPLLPGQRNGRRAADVPLPSGEIFAAKLSVQERLRFARQVLGSLLFICVGVFAAYAALPDNPAMAAIFELIKIGALPLVTLVISFYFPSKVR